MTCLMYTERKTKRAEHCVEKEYQRSTYKEDWRFVNDKLEKKKKMA